MINLKLIIIIIVHLLLASLYLNSCSDKSNPADSENDLTDEEYTIEPYDIDYDDPEKYVISGIQTTITAEQFTNISQYFKFETINFAALKKIYDWKNSFFQNVNAGGKYVGKNTINDLLQNKELTGCHDHGLVLVSLLRKFKMPAIMVDATGIGWALLYPDQVSYFSGHVLIEIYLDNKWMLFDSVNGIYISDYNPRNPIIPITTSNEDIGYYAMFKGLDPAEYGITDIQHLNDVQKQYAIMIKQKYPGFVFPNYTIEYL